MTPERWQQVDQLLEIVLELHPTKRTDFLDEACAGDRALREEVESLLSAHTGADGFLEHLPVETLAELAEDSEHRLGAGESIGRYEIISWVGRGGMGEVYLAQDARLRRRVALKLLPEHLFDDGRSLRRLEQEARALAALSHPNVCVIHEVIEAVDGRHCLVMEYVDGVTLRDHMAGRQLNIGEALDVAIQVASALAAAHEAGVIHCDVKPENIVVRRDAVIKVLDFGLAKLETGEVAAQSTPSPRQRETVPGLLVGTVRYMSPEQVRGLTVDARTDVWSLGVVFYEMTSGHSPFDGPTDSDVLAAVLGRDPVPPTRYSAEVPETLDWIVAKALAKAREDRYHTASALLTDLRRLKQRVEMAAELRRSTPVEGSRDGSPRAIGPERGSLRFDSWRRAIVAAVPWVVLVAVLAAIGYGVRGRYANPDLMPGPQESGAVLKTTQITSSTGLDFYPAFSSDGNAIAYSSERSGSFEIYVKQLAPGGGEIQVTSDGQQNLQPAWSPDGKLLAYHSKQRRGIWLVPALGGAAQRLTEFGSRPSWSPDGSLLAFQSDGLSILRPLGRSAMPPSTIWLIAARGGAPSQLTRPGQPPGGHGAPAWSPDGTRLVFVAHDRDSVLETVEVASGAFKRVLSGKACCRLIFDPLYAPDGRSIYFPGVDDNEPALWRVSVSTDGDAVGEPEAVMHSGATFFRHLSFAPDGRRLAYSIQGIASNLRSVSVSSSGEPTGVASALTEDTSFWRDVSFSPDGRRVYYFNYPIGTAKELWLMDANGANRRQVLTPRFDGPIGWFGRDAERLVLLSRRPAGVDVRTLTLDGGREERLATLWPDANDVRVSPDATRVVFNSKRSGTINLWTQSFAGGEARQLTFDKESMGFARWSPDGRLLAFQMKRGDNDHVVVMPSSGGSLTQLTFERGRDAPRSWSPDGDKILFAGTRESLSNLWWVSRTTREQEQVTRYRKLNVSVDAAAWSPQGDRIVYEYAEIRGNIWIMQLR